MLPASVEQLHVKKATRNFHLTSCCERPKLHYYIHVRKKVSSVRLLTQPRVHTLSNYYCFIFLYVCWFLRMQNNLV